MESAKDTKPGGLQSTFSRRNLLKGAAALTAAASMPEAFGQQPTGAPSGTVWLYIGTYTGAPGSGGNGAGDLLMRAQSFHGEVNRPEARSSGFAGRRERTHPQRVHLRLLSIRRARTCMPEMNIGPPGAVSAYSINRLTGDLTLLNVQPAVGAPAHVSVDQVAGIFSRPNTQAAGFEVFPILANGSLGPAVFQMQTLGNVDTSFKH